jgi:primosomal protein N' (replication factor Y)
LIFIDEEHDAAYKQGETPRYHARDLAVIRAQYRHIPLVLASATPSFESLANVQRRRYNYQSLPERVGKAVLPSIILAPSKALSPVKGIGHHLHKALVHRLEQGEQSLLFFNRRGYAPRLVCGNCQWHGQCPHCDAAMIFHRIGQRLHCHRCDHKIPLPRRCPSCATEPLLPMGSGTQQLEEQVRLGFPQARIARIDLDSTRNKDAWPQLRAQILQREVDIILGTQMVVKGHDFPALSLVGVLGADEALFGIDFRAGERLYAQLTQVAGRAGRGDIAGEVIIQTDFPQHPVYQAIVQGQGAEYVANALAERAAHGWPPESYLALIRVESLVPELARKTLHALWQSLAQLQTPTSTPTQEQEQAETAVRCYPPVPSPLAKIAKFYRWQMLISSTHRTLLHQHLRHCHEFLSAEVKRPNRFIIDVDPVDTY